MIRFNKTFNSFVLTNDERFNLTEIETEGNTLDELVNNCRVYVETWHGNPSYSYNMLTDLWDSDVQEVIEVIEEYMAFNPNLPLVV